MTNKYHGTSKDTENLTVGKPIPAGDVLSKTLGILTANPVLFLPQLVTLIFGLLTTLFPRVSPLNPLGLFSIGLLVQIASFVVGIIVSGAYPFLVKAIVDGGKLSLTDALGRAYHKFWTLLGAGILVGLVVVLGLIALIVPGLILLTWYIYTVPAIMLENKGASEGMAASKAFGRDKKWSTFLMFLAVGVGYIIISVIVSSFTLGGLFLLGQVADQILIVPVGAWLSVIISYTYISYGPSSVVSTAGASGYGMAPPASTAQTMVQTGALSPSNFCSSCGSQLQSSAKFCHNCGKAV